MNHNTLILRKGAERRLRAGHVWIYSNEVDIQRSPLVALQPGEQVLVQGANGKPLGTAFVNPHTLICARLISRDPAQWFTRRLLEQRLQQAESLRQSRFEQHCYRLAYGDSDGLPGLVIDRFGEDAVVQISNAGMEHFKQDLHELLHARHGLRRVFFRNDAKLREAEGLAISLESPDDPQPADLQLVENGVQFRVPALGGQKTGWFYDHRQNRALLRHYVPGKRVLDVFSYVGGWGVQAACFGASQVTCVDSSQSALEQAQRNAALNGVDDRMATLCGDAFEVLKALREQEEKYDVIVLDPPAFIPRRKDIEAGEAAYSRINQQALQLLRPGGILVSASCSMHLQRERLLDILRAAGRTIDRFVQVIEQGHQGADHPILPAVPETDYLKAFFVRASYSL